jgi:carboxylesterase type B
MFAFNTPGPPAGESEDCLYINIFAPRTSGRNKAVMFWIYGGFLDFGSNSAAYYDGSSFAANQDVIVVAPNYRTNGEHKAQTQHFESILTSYLQYSASRGPHNFL